MGALSVPPSHCGKPKLGGWVQGAEGRIADLTAAAHSTSDMSYLGASLHMALAWPSGPQWPCPSCVISSWSSLHATPADTRDRLAGTYLGRTWLGCLAGPGHGKGALGSTGLPGRQAASWTLCGLVTATRETEWEGGRQGRKRCWEGHETEDRHEPPVLAEQRVVPAAGSLTRAQRETDSDP